MSREPRGNGARRRPFTPEEKATILRRHLVNKIPVSELCDEHRIQPALYYLWQRQALEHMSAALQDGRTRPGETQTAAGERARIAALDAKLVQMAAVIAEEAEEYLALKIRFITEFRAGP